MYTNEQIIDKLIEVDKISEKLNDADKIICMTEIIKQSCIKVGIDNNKLFVLGNRVYAERFKVYPQNNYNKNIVRLLFTGRLQDQKNIHGITQALKIVKKKGYKIDFHVCGGTVINEYLEKCLAILEKDEYTYYGAMPNRKLSGLYKKVDMYIGPSFFEGFQIPLIEALASGKPCITSNQPPANEIITKETGELVDPDCAESIANGIISLKERLNNIDENKEIRNNCKERSLLWDFYRVSGNEANIYLNLLKK